MSILNNDNLKNLTKDGVTVIDFYAKWCNPCKLQAPIFDSLKNELDDQANFIKIDIEENMDIVNEYHVKSVPTIVIIKGGEVMESTVGFVPKDDLEELIKKYIEKR